MNRKLALLVGLTLAGAFLLPSAAAPFSGSGDRVHQDLVLHPHSGPNGDYAMLDENDKLELNFGPSNPNVTGDGVNPDAVTPFDRVFNITYTGEASADVWLTSNVAGVSFYRGADPTNSIEGADNTVTLGPGQTLEVGVLIDTTGGTIPSGDTFTLNAEVGETTTTDESTTGGGDGGNGGGGGGGDADGDFQVQENDGGSDPTETPTPETGNGESETGDGVSTPTDGGPVFEVSSASVSQTTVAPGESVTVDATVENVGSADGTATVQLFANGDPVATTAVQVPAGESRDLSFTTRFDTVGEYELRVEGTTAGTVLVESAQSTTELPTAQSTPVATGTVVPVTSAEPAEEPSPVPDQSSEFPWLAVWLALLGISVAVTGYWTLQYTAE